MNVTTIFGPPGTGKTTRLMQIAHERCMKSKGLLLSYTKAAAQEIASRINAGDLRASTLHSLAFQRLGLNRASVVDQVKLKEFGEKCGIPFKGMEGADGEQEGDEYLSVYSFGRNRLLTEEDAYDAFGRPGSPARFNMCIHSYEQWKTTFGYMDFDDMLTKASRLKFPVVPNVLLDEAQDLSPLQWGVFEAVIKDAKDVFIAGDDDQAIYEWSGADPHGMDQISERYAGTVEVLGQSHRVPKSVLSFARSHTLEHIERRVKKVFKPAARDGHLERWGIFKCLAPADPDWQTLIMARDNYRLRELQTELHEARVPYAMATSNGPYENRYARALRAWFREGPPAEDEREAVTLVGSELAVACAKERNWKALRALDWSRSIQFPPRMRDFYWDLGTRPDMLFMPLRVRLSTIHQAKGSEADLVILDCAMTDRVLAGIDLNTDAELRVWYVGLTRARHELHLTGENPLI